MSNLEALYQEVILDHNRKPRNFREMENADRRVEGRNPLCGDEITLWVKLDGDRLTDVSFKGSGCAVSKSSASLMTASVKGKTKAEAELLFDEFHKMVKGELNPNSDPHHLGRLAIFAGVCEFPARVKCASLSWHTLRAALEGTAEPVSTE